MDQHQAGTVEPFLAPAATPRRPPESALGLLLRVRFLALRNHAAQLLVEHPLKVAGTTASILLIWTGMYALLVRVFQEINRQLLEGIVATPLIFTFFFLALTCMLTFSNAIICYGSLFRRQESAYLMAGPLPRRDIVLLKYLESLTLASWSVVLLGVPMMFAVARVFEEDASFYPLFLGLFVAFIPIPGAVGLLLAWGVVRFSPRTPERTLTLAGVAVLALIAWWGWRLFRSPAISGDWLAGFYDRVSVAQSALLPHTWVSNGIASSLQGRPAAGLFYLLVTAANGLFASMVAVRLVASGLAGAYDRAQICGSGKRRRAGRMLSWVAEILFAYLPSRQRLLAAKDLKAFFRDPLQWSQMAILLGLLTLYVSNVQQLWTELATPGLQVLIGFLNLTAVALILATFTSRFVFPLVSLEVRHLWLLGLLPLSRTQMVVSKLLYSLTITVLVALAVTGVSVYRLSLPSALAFTHLVAITAMCVGLCGISTGMGARMPMINERNPARIAGGLGGVIGLMLSVGLVAASLAGVGVMSFRMVWTGQGAHLSGSVLAWLAAVVLLNTVAAAASMIAGIRHFNRSEF